MANHIYLYVVLYVICLRRRHRNHKSRAFISYCQRIYYVVKYFSEWITLAYCHHDVCYQSIYFGLKMSRIWTFMLAELLFIRDVWNKYVICECLKVLLYKIKTYWMKLRSFKLIFMIASKAYFHKKWANILWYCWNKSK